MVICNFTDALESVVHDPNLSMQMQGGLQWLRFCPKKRVLVTTGDRIYIGGTQIFAEWKVIEISQIET